MDFFILFAKLQLIDKIPKILLKKTLIYSSQASFARRLLHLENADVMLSKFEIEGTYDCSNYPNS